MHVPDKRWRLWRKISDKITMTIFTDDETGRVEADTDKFYEYFELCAKCKKTRIYVHISDPHALEVCCQDCWDKLPENEK